MTEYLGIAPAIAGTLILLSRIWDIGASMVVGQWSDRTESRWGRRVPFLFYGAPVAALGYAVLFSTPHLEGPWTEIFALVALIIYATGYSLFVVPYLTVPAEITAIPQQRTTMMSFRVVAMTVAGLNVGVLGPMLLNVFGGGYTGYVGMGWLQGALILAFMWLSTFLISRAPVIVQAETSRVGYVEQVRMVLAQKPFRVFIGVKLFQLFAASSTTAALLYLARYVLDQDESFLIRFTSLQMAGTLVSLPLWSWLAKRYGKRNTYMGAGFSYALIALSWLTTALGEPFWATDIRMFMVGVGSAGLLVVGFSILPDTMENNTRQTGLSQEGTMAAVYSMVEKGTAAGAPFLAGLVLQISGFISGAGSDLPPEQPQSAITAIFVLVALIPAACNVAGGLLLTRYTLDERQTAAAG
jgi:GPH family glycoside/pentoside/hexuronide:cation symporter